MSRQVDVLSLDHDLGDDTRIGTGYDVLLWLEEKVAMTDFTPPETILVHSSNTSAVQKMRAAIHAIQRINEGDP
ncbi:cyclic-phosphate processing receiver domain-containing protein [Vibrio sp. 10N.286.49.B1]|uniref:cyclic-phosphate processing receiver domain-containing protein n=1 Tax=unclassified Vibrio TaxID=2614977 RepID=UPI001F52BA17|nr:MULTISPECIES: cyclic-phosphate processing receiver domain-containing protein [unclassified Vibrio]